ncbi:MAG: alkylmercury lyase family protein [Polyangia bacterium]
MTLEDLVQSSVSRLNGLLPLKARQDRLSPELKALHRAVVTVLVTQGRAPSRAEAAAVVGEAHVDDALARLGKDDLVVLSPDRQQILGAYPASLETTPHVVELHGHSIHAMCSIDALAISAVFSCDVTIRSSCRVTHEPVLARQVDGLVVEATPAAVLVGVRWKAPAGECAAHSLCREMVFLKDAAAAAKWHGGDLDNHSLYTLSEAVAFAAAYFRPLV